MLKQNEWILASMAALVIGVGGSGCSREGNNGSSTPGSTGAMNGSESTGPDMTATGAAATNTTPTATGAATATGGGPMNPMTEGTTVPAGANGTASPVPEDKSTSAGSATDNGSTTKSTKSKTAAPSGTTGGSTGGSTGAPTGNNGNGGSTGSNGTSGGK